MQKSKNIIILLHTFPYYAIEDKVKFVVDDIEETDIKFILEEISYYIMKSLQSFDDKTIIVTFEMPITNTIKINNSNNLFN
jgi:hypothetical protein